MSDLISRGDAVALVIKAIHGTDNKEIKEYLFDGLRKQMWSLPSAESTGAMDEAIQEYIKDGYMQPIGEDLISRQSAIDAFRDVLDSDFPYISEVTPRERIESIPSEPEPSRQPGKWTDGHGNEMFRYCHGGYCSVCGEESEDLTDYCGNCGAPMIVRDGEDDADE